MSSRNTSAGLRDKSRYQIHYKPEIRQLVSDAPRTWTGLERVDLGSEKRTAGHLQEVIARRRSTRFFGDDALQQNHLAELLNDGIAVQRTIETDPGTRTYLRPFPNSGNLGSIEVYPIVLNVVGIPPGVYHYSSTEQHLTLLHSGQMRSWLGEHVFFQSGFPGAAVVFVLVASFVRLVTKYGERGWRFGYLDAGHVSQNLNLLATDMGLAVCTTAGFVDAALDRAIGADGLDETAVLAVLVGQPEIP